MNILIPLTISILAVILIYFANSVLLLWVCKIFKITNANFKKSLLISLLEIVFGLIVGGLTFLSVDSSSYQALGQILMIVVGFLIFHFLLRKFYQTKMGKNLAIYVVLNILVVIFSLVIIIPIRYFVVQPFYNVGAGMEPTFQDYDYLFVKMYDNNYQRGDIVIFRYPKDLSQYFIKRIVGLPGEKVSIVNSKVLINGQILDESKYISSDTLTPDLGQKELILGANEYFVLGDNRTASLDSRKFGAIKNDLIIGKYWFTGVKANQKQ